MAKKKKSVPENRGTKHKNTYVLLAVCGGSGCAKKAPSVPVQKTVHTSHTHQFSEGSNIKPGAARTRGYASTNKLTFQFSLLRVIARAKLH